MVSVRIGRDYSVAVIFILCSLWQWRIARSGDMGVDGMGSEGNSMGTRINILVVVAKANFYIRDMNLI